MGNLCGDAEASGSPEGQSTRANPDNVGQDRGGTAPPSSRRRASPQTPIAMNDQPERHHLTDAEATRALGRELALRLQADCRPGQAPLLLLQGQLGAGKTCLVQGLAEALGIAEPITSPTFALAQHYDAPGATPLVHLDLYRLDQPAAAEELLAQEEEEAMAQGAVLAVEWPERLRRLPADGWRVHLELSDPDHPDAGRLATVIPPQAAAARP